MPSNLLEQWLNEARHGLVLENADKEIQKFTRSGGKAALKACKLCRSSNLLWTPWKSMKTHVSDS